MEHEVENRTAVPGAEEKGVTTAPPTTHTAPAYNAREQEEYEGNWRDQEDFMTRNGLNLRSFQRRPKGGPLVVLDKSMKTRHLHMIAIGGSIGAGFFVGSGGALHKGVSLNA